MFHSFVTLLFIGLFYFDLFRDLALLYVVQHVANEFLGNSQQFDIVQIINFNYIEAYVWISIFLSPFIIVIYAVSDILM